jgi:glycosyltransferase involved in cell wall biosynthesis
VRKLRIFTWHVHGSYLYYLSQAPHEFYIPVKPDLPPAYTGRRGPFPWPANVREIPAEEVRRTTFDCILFQSSKHYLEDQYEILSAAQRRLPRIYLEHDPPRQHPTDSRHVVDDPEVLLVHVTSFNDLMWDAGRTPTRVIDHGIVSPPGVRYSGELSRGLAVVNGLPWRGRRTGVDVIERVRREIPLDVVGMASDQIGGLGEVPHDRLPAFQARYRFFFHPVRYTSLGLAVLEAMMIGMPVVGFATTELPTVITNGATGYIDTDLDRLIGHMRRLIADPIAARRVGEAGRRTARARFSIDRFVRDWNDALALVTGAGRTAAIPGAGGQPAGERLGVIRPHAVPHGAILSQKGTL